MNQLKLLNMSRMLRSYSTSNVLHQQKQLTQKIFYDHDSMDHESTNLKKNNLIYREQFHRRHIGIAEKDKKIMLEKVGVKSLEEFIEKVVPKDILDNKDLKLSDPMTESEFLKYAKSVASKNQLFRSFIGMGYYNCHTPTVIQRNIFENPGWVTQYTPYQAELSQGRLESLLNFQTMICDLTGLAISNASLLDESTAAAEAMTMCVRSNGRSRFLVSNKVHPQTIDLIKTRAAPINIQVEVVDLNEMNFSKKDVSGFLFQYPDTDGTISNLENIIKTAKNNGTISVCATDLLALCLIKSPAEIGAEVAIGSAQRFGVPLGYGGPHAAFFAVEEKFKRFVPGRIIGVSRDSNGKQALRLSLQTREQHIRQEKATSNICTAQALLANMAAFYAIYYGPDGLKKKALHAHNNSLILVEGLKRGNHTVLNNQFFDTIKVKPNTNINSIRSKALSKKINLRYYDDNQHIGIALDDTVTTSDINDLLEIFDCKDTFDSIVESVDIYSSDHHIMNMDHVKRKNSYMKHPVFNSYQSETLLTRYMKQLENKDISLVHSMIPLGSCTMKLNATTELMPCSWPEFNSIHPFVPKDQVKGYMQLMEELCNDLCEITGYDKISLQPNSGAQGEYAGLRAIMSYLDSIGQKNRRVCLVPTSAHGTNAASAAMAGMKILKLNVLKNGSIDMNHLSTLAKQYEKDLACVMITYPSTYGIFESKIRDICDMTHHFGAQVYMDGANLNAQVGLCKPGHFGSDVSHMNLHKTFCIPHGGGGPGMGPIGVKKHLAPFLPSHAVIDIDGVNRKLSFGSCSASPFGSSSILPISWAYIKMMGKKLRHASEMAILNANYMMKRLEKAYHVNFVGDNGFCAHEFIINADFKATANVEATDIAKRLQDYGFHSATVSWPVHGALMIEPTESESKEELDRFCDALLSIREEIAKIEKGVWDKQNNPIKNAPHTQELCISSKWNRPYDRETAAFPISYLKPETKTWPTIGRIDDTYGDKNLVIRRL